MEWTLIFCCLYLSVAIVHGRGFYFPDEVEAKAQSSAFSNGFGNSQANANANANSNGNRSPLSLYVDDYDGYGSQNFPNRYPSQGFNPYYDRPSYNVNPYPSLNGHFHNNAPLNSQYGNGGANAAAAAASAGTGFGNGGPAASAAAAAAAAAAGNGGSSAASSAASAGAGGGSRYPNFQYPESPYPYGGLYANNYGHRHRQPWQYRSGGDYESRKFDVVDAIVKGVDSIVFDD